MQQSHHEVSSHVPAKRKHTHCCVHLQPSMAAQMILLPKHDVKLPQGTLVRHDVRARKDAKSGLPVIADLHEFLQAHSYRVAESTLMADFYN